MKQGDRKDPHPRAALSESELEQIAGGFNPQPEPPPSGRLAAELSYPLEAQILARWEQLLR